MKKIYALVTLTFSVLFVSAQNRSFVAGQTELAASKTQTANKTSVVKDTLWNSVKGKCADTVIYYYADSKAPWDSGFATGNNALKDKKMLQRHKLKTSGNNQVYGALAQVYKHGSWAAKAYVYSVDGAATGHPKTLLGTSDANSSNLILPNTLATFTFSTSVAVTDSFFIAVDVPNTGGSGDTLIVFTTKIGCYGVPNRSYWQDLNDNFEPNFKYGFNVDCQIFPIVDKFNTGINEVTHAANILNAYPNPAADNIQLTYAVTNASAVTIQVMDLSGRVVMSVNKGHMAEGSYIEALDVAALSNGAYFFSIISNNGVSTSKFTVVH